MLIHCIHSEKIYWPHVYTWKNPTFQEIEVAYSAQHHKDFLLTTTNCTNDGVTSLVIASTREVRDGSKYFSNHSDMAVLMNDNYLHL